MANNMKFLEHRGIADSMGNLVLGIIRRSITYIGKGLIVIGMPHLE